MENDSYTCLYGDWLEGASNYRMDLICIQSVESSNRNIQPSSKIIVGGKWYSPSNEDDNKTMNAFGAITVYVYK